MDSELHQHGSWVGKTAWWKDAVFYQVYPASFKDSNGDGWGDIPGLVSEIDYLQTLGVDVVWPSPMYVNITPPSIGFRMLKLGP